MPGWRNGRRCGLKIRCPKGRAGSTPALGTNINLLLLQQRVLFLEIDPCPVLHAPSFEKLYQPRGHPISMLSFVPFCGFTDSSRVIRGQQIDGESMRYFRRVCNERFR